MQSLIDFFEKETNKKINIFKYNNEKINSNQNLVTFNNTTYIVEFIKNNILNHINGYCYLFNQQNLDFVTLDSLPFYLKTYLFILTEKMLERDIKKRTLLI